MAGFLTLRQLCVLVLELTKQLLILFLLLTEKNESLHLPQIWPPFCFEDT